MADRPVLQNITNNNGEDTAKSMRDIAFEIFQKTECNDDVMYPTSPQLLDEIYESLL